MSPVQSTLVCSVLLAMTSFEVNNHVVEDDTTLDPLHSKIQVLLFLNLEPQLLEGLEPPLQSSKCMFNMYTNLNTFKFVEKIGIKKKP